LHCLLTREEDESVINGCHSGACGGNLSGLATFPKILRAGYFGLDIFKYCVKEVKKCHHFEVFNRNMRSHLSPLHLVITIGPFTKWGVSFLDCNPTLAGGNQHIIMTIEYFNKWEEAMPTIKSDGNTATLFRV
jgi:hypothetical protein